MTYSLFWQGREQRPCPAPTAAVLTRFLLPVALVWSVILGTGAATAAAAAAQEGSPVNTLPPITVGRCTVGWTPKNGLSVAYDGVPVVRKSSLYLVKAGWNGVLLDQSSAPVRISPWTDTSVGKTARIALENENAACIYTLTVAAPDTVTVALTYRLMKDVPAEIEYAAAYLSGPVLQGAAFIAATADGERRGQAAATPPARGRSQEANRLAPPFERLAFNTRLGGVSLRYSGDAPRPIIFDARSEPQGWAREFPVFWMGIGAPAQPIAFQDGQRRATFTFAFSPSTPLSAAGERLGRPSAGVGASAGVRAVPNARVPYVPPTPLVIPRPKQMTVTGKPFRINRQTRIVVADGATAADKQGAEILRQELQKRFGQDTPLVRARDVVRGTNVIVIGDGNRNAALTRLLSVENVSVPDKPEGYALVVTPRSVLVAGRDRQGAFWGVQTLAQLLVAETEGAVQVRPVRIMDWPTLSVRAVHLFHGQNALPFHKRLIDRVFSPFKLNALFLQAEQLRWDANPAIAPAWAGRKEQVKEEIEYARQRGITVYPLVQSMGHMEWLFAGKRNLEYAEDPQTPYALNITNPAALAHLGRINAEADGLFDAPAFHVGLDEVTMRGRFPYRSAPRTFADLYLTGVNHWRSFFAKRGKPIWMWADMLLHPSEVAPSFGTAPTPADAARLRREVPKDIVLVDWQYGPHERFPSLKLLKDAGFSVVAATWFNPANIQNFAREAAQVGALGAMQTTWAGYESKADVLQTEHRKQFTAMVLAADYFWNGGAGPAPEDLPYDAQEVFTRQMEEPLLPVKSQTRSGFIADLSPLANRPLPDWLGYGAAHGPASFPTGDTRGYDGTLYRFAPGALLLEGKLNPSGSYPATRDIPLASRVGDAIVARQVKEIDVALAASHPTAPGTKIGAMTMVMDDGTKRTVDLVYGRNISAASDTTALPDAAVVWKGRMGDGQPFLVRRVSWKNPSPDLPVRGITITSTGTESAPAVFAVTALE